MNLHLVDLIQAPETVADSINHSCDSNVWLQDEVTIVARRAIAAGEELTLDYALTTVEPDWQLDQPCQCGTSACRHSIRGTDWQLPEVQQRYQGHFAPFINERIRKSNPREGKGGGMLPSFRFETVKALPRSRPLEGLGHSLVVRVKKSKDPGL